MRKILYAYTLSECMDLMAEYVQAFEKQGERTILFCEDRLTLIAEKTLTKKTGGSFFSSVSTFSRFLKSEQKILSKQGSVMAIGEMMSALQKEGKLDCFKSAESVKNGAQSMYEMIAQLSSSKISKEVLWDSCERLEEGILKNKMHDLACVYEGYEAFLSKNGYFDESRYLSLLPQRIRSSSQMDGGTVFFLCYSAFTKQGMDVVRACAERAKNVIGIFIGGKEEFYTNTAINAFQSALEEFGCKGAENRGTPLVGEAEWLRKGLYSPAFLTLHKGGFDTDKIHVFEGGDKYSEGEYVASHIRKLLMENPDWRYRDFAVLVSDSNGYALPLKKAFEEYQIPVFFDVKRSLKSHPLSKFLLSALAVKRENFSPATVQNLLSNAFFGESDEYRNYLYKYANYRGGAKREIKEERLLKGYDYATLCEGRNRLLSLIEPIPSRATGRGYAHAIRKILEVCQGEERLALLEEETKDVAMKSYLSQIFPHLEALLEEAELIIGEETLTLSDFEVVLSGGLEATQISLIPLKVDAVFVGDITDSRIEKAKVVFAVGMTDAVPRNAEDVALLSDKEMDRLSEEFQATIDPKVYEVNLRCRESVCLNLCAFLDELHLTYSLSSKGEEPSKSEILRYMQLFQKDGRPLPIEKEGRDDVYTCSTPSLTLKKMLTERQRLTAGGQGDIKRYTNLYETLIREGVLTGLEKGEEARVFAPETKELFFKGNTSLSPSVLEGYFKCPFSNFLERGLRLKKREEEVVLSTDSGTFVHALLEEMSREYTRLKTEEEARAFAKAKGEELLASPEFSAQEETEAGKLSLQNLLNEGVESSVAVYRHLVNSKFEVYKIEENLSTPDFHGKVDRVDVAKVGDKEYVRVIDYKTGNIHDEAVLYYTGNKIQRQLYLQAVMEDRIPASVFYFPASISFQKEGNINFKMSGFMNEDYDAIQAGDTTLQEGEESNFFHAKLGENKSKDMLDEEAFRSFIEYSSYVVQGASKEIQKGFIPPSPYGKSCSYCKYGGICGFRADTMVIREEEAISSNEIAEIAKREKSAKEGKVCR